MSMERKYHFMCRSQEFYFSVWFLLGDTLSVIILLAVSPERGFFVKGQG